MAKSNYIVDQKTHLIYKDKKEPFEFLFNPMNNRFLRYLHGKRLNKIIWPISRVVLENAGYLYRSRKMKKWNVVPNRLLFFTFQKNYACNCKYIAEKIREQALDYELIFIVSDTVYENRKAYDIPQDVYLVRINSPESFYAMATSRFWFDNGLNCLLKPGFKKSSQIYIDTWHGSLGIKRLSGGKYWRYMAKQGNKVIDYFLTDSVFDEKVFSESFWPNVKHLKFGHPRNDIFFDSEKLQSLKKKVYQHYHIPESTHLALYAPTFRDNKSDISAIHINHQKLIEALHSRFGGEWKILNRLHFHNASNPEAQKHELDSDSVINATDYQDMQELLAAAEVGITDYSSWIFDFLFTGRPGFIYANDIEKYIHDRGFYYPLSETPFSISDSDTQLSQNILDFDFEEYNKKVHTFLEGKGCYENGNACMNVVQFIRDLS